MPFIKGHTFYEMNRIPDKTELAEIIRQAALINRINHRPAYLYDRWAVPNIENIYQEVKAFLSSDDKSLLEKTIADYRTLDIENLPKSFVHGDFTKTNIIKADDGRIYIIDFSVANYYARIQELAVIVANCMFDGNKTSLQARCGTAVQLYTQYNPLSDYEINSLPIYAKAAAAMEFLGSCREKYINGSDLSENDYWLELGRASLRNP